MTWQAALWMLPGLIVGLTVHEFAHAWTASLLGDGFARRQGRVSLNPLRHLSPLGTLAIFLLPFGWGRPVPVNLYNFRNPRRDYLLTSLAGPAANVLVAALCLGLMLLTRHPYRFEPPHDHWIVMTHQMLQFVAIINVLLATFNLIPIPPLDGSKIWPCLIPGLKPGGRSKSTWIFLIVLVALLWTNSLAPVVHFAISGVDWLMPVSDTELFQDYGTAGNHALEKQSWAEAERNYTEALAINPRADGLMVARAGVRMKQGKWNEALADVSRAIQLCREPYYYEVRAIILRNLGRNEEARADEEAAQAMEETGALEPATP